MVDLVGRYCYPDLTDNLAAVVSTHGYFEIQCRETYNSYASGISPVYKDGELCPTPVVVFEGPVSDLGLTYEPWHDDLADKDDDFDHIKSALLTFLAEREWNDRH